MLNQFSRTELLIGKDGIKKLHKAKVAVFGLGGVGSFVVEGLVRSGVQDLVLIDNDTVSLTNLNRQLIALHSTIGKDKVEVVKERVLDINPNAKVKVYKEFVSYENISMITKDLSYVVDCVDTVTAKLAIIEECNKLNIPVISCMGTGNKLDPSKFEIADIYKTSVCPLAKVIRKELRARNIDKLKVLYSKEEPIKVEIQEETKNGNPVPGSISFVPSCAGLMIAGEVIKDIINN